jgi:arabinose-5-phosphate isomerase
MKPDDVLGVARRVISVEEKAVGDLLARLNSSFVRAVELIYGCKGRVVVTGIGKSGIIGRKISATMASTGTPSFFLHPAEGSHGDLGMVVKGDAVMAISNSGETVEILSLLPVIKRLAIPLIALTGNPSSTLAKRSDVVLDVSVREEASSLAMAPTASTTAALAMGDALAVALLEMKGFSEEDFALLHPGGTIGKRLLLKVEDLMHVGNEIPLVTLETTMKDVILEISSKRLGITTVVDDQGHLQGVITDGDLRRILERHGRSFFELEAGQVMTKKPKTISGNALAARALQVMEKHSITALVVSNEEGKPTGIIHLHDLLKAGIV